MSLDSWSALDETAHPSGGFSLVLSLPSRPRRRWRRLLPVAVVAFGLGTLAWGTGYSFGPIRERSLALGAAASPPSDPTDQDLARLRAQHRKLAAALRQKSPRGTHIIIDQTHNRLVLKKDDAIVLQATCSAGSGMILEEGTDRGGKGRRWIFDTPRGKFAVLSKIEDPVWKKPDWAFVEEGKPIPKNPADRIEYGTLGEYALYFGNGYMIHGTLYERLLGRSVTHGCIRLGRDDLRTVFRSAPVGTPIYIY